MNVNDKAPLSDEARASWVLAEGEQLSFLWRDKVSKGRIEHGNDLGNIPVQQLLSEAINEVLDQFSYLRELQRRSKILPADTLLVPRVTLDKIVTHMEQFANIMSAETTSAYLDAVRILGESA